MADGEHIRHRAIGALAAVVGLALGLGVVLAAGAYAAARMVGLTDDGDQQATAPAVQTPSGPPSASAAASRRPTAAPSPSSTGHHEDATSKDGRGGQQAQPSPQHRHAQHRQQARPDRQQHQRSQRQARRHHRHRRPRQQPATGTVTLHAAQTRVRPMGRVDLDGRCGCRSGTTLVVQRLQHGRWSRFPATATASRGRFHTWVMTGRRGSNQFRVVVPGGRVSHPVTIVVR